MTPHKQPITAENVTALLRPTQRLKPITEACAPGALDASDVAQLQRQNAAQLKRIETLETALAAAQEKSYLAQAEVINRDLAWTDEAGRLQARVEALTRTVETQRERLQALELEIARRDAEAAAMAEY